jgi:hypothetical protein
MTPSIAAVHESLHGTFGPDNRADDPFLKAKMTSRRQVPTSQLGSARACFLKNRCRRIRTNGRKAGH